MGLGCSLFARHYSGSRGFFPFLRLLRCFSSPACHCSPYVFRREHARITTRRFPHSEIPGSKVGQHLTRAYRSRPRPSSALSAKASTVCSCSLDRKEHVSPLWSFQGARDRLAPSPSKLNSVLVEVDVFQARLCIGRLNRHLPRRHSRQSLRGNGTNRATYRSKCSGIP
jgi:hypothetical protein